MNPRTVHAVKEAIADIVESEIADPRLNLVTITDIKLTPDFEHATVWYSLLSPELVPDASVGDHLPDEGEAAAGFAAARARIQSLLGRRVKMRRTPELQFELDPVAVQAARVEDLIRRVRADERGR